ncbi:HEPN domain-containing protein [Candidatus Bathyarchaeota archaeon]|nr:HEPN domain-containing protein [Candidatus Bathyarchaeota archaeon]MBS7629431.1 HEPN domain-containing protein [Candidatus Bathyarchaeota archaeon]
MVMRCRDWLRQAVKDLEHARKSVETGDYEWACFASHQSAEKAVKALYQSIHIDAIGHSISRMFRDLPEKLKPPKDLIQQAKELDKHYIPTRYPNFHPEGAPLDYYTYDEALKAVEEARRIVEYCRSKIPEDQIR